MNGKYSRNELMEQLQEALDLVGAKSTRWPEMCRARLAAFVENDKEAARLFAEAKALDEVLSYAPEGSPGVDVEARILAAAAILQQGDGPAADIGGLVGRRRGGIITRTFRPISRPSYWGGAALLAASLALGVYIGVTGEAVPTLRGMTFLASSDEDAGLAFSGSLFEPSGLHEQGEL